MGYNAAWVASQAEDEAAMLSSIGMEVVVEASSELNVAHAMARLPNGWLVVVSPGFGANYDDAARTVSSAGVAFSGVIYERLMISGLRCYHEGALEWFVAHDPDEGEEHLSVKGSPPDAFARVRQEVADEAAAEPDDDVDYVFDVPVRLGAEIVGFDPYRRVDTVWSVLAPIKSCSTKLDSSPRLSTLIENEVVARLIDRGWRPLSAEERPQVWAPQGAFEIYRRVGRTTHVVSFTFWETAEVFLHIDFFVADETYPGHQPILVGRVPSPKKSFWRRLLLSDKPTTAERRRRAAVEDANDRLTVLESFLDGRGGDCSIRVNGGLAKDCWPAMPPHAEG